MSFAVQDAKRKLPATPWGFLPPRMRVLFITGVNRTGGWLAEAFASDSASEVVMDEAIGMAEGLATLRDEAFDAVLVSHEGQSLDALEIIDAIRAGSSDEQPIIVLGEPSDREMTPLCYEAGGDGYVCVGTTTTRALIWQVARAMERHELLAENRRLQQAHRHRLQLEHDEANRLLQQQRRMIADLERLVECPPDDESPARRESVCCPDLPRPLVEHYRELLRAYVIMGSGNLGEEMNRLAELLASAAISAQQAMVLHLHVLEEMVDGLGSRSARHVMNRADMLILEVMINLAEGYRDRFLKRVRPPRQMRLPGFDD
jgi:DNA-binding response OmpR family regulator